MTGRVENAMAVDWFWDEEEYGVPDRRRLKRQAQAYREAEGEEREDEG